MQNYYLCNYYNHNNCISILLSNPFVISKSIPEEYFCDRETETATLIKQIVNGRNVALISSRRLGKTGLIHHVFRQPEISNNYHVFFVDLYSTTCLAELIMCLGKEIERELKSRGEKIIDRFFDSIKSLRVGISLDTVTGEPGLDLGIGDISSPQTTLDEIFEYLESADKPCIVAIDEFQQIANYPEKNVEALIRTKIQNCNNTSFIYSGSKKHIMANMFSSPSRPFYNSSITMGLNAIPLSTYTEFAEKMFSLHNKQVNKDVVIEVYNRFEGYTWFMQMLMNELFAITPVGSVCSVKDIEPAITNILSIQEMAHEETLALIPTKQKDLLYAIMKDGYAINITSGNFIKRHRLSTPSSVQSALKGLLEKNIIVQTQNNTAYRIENFFFAEWLNRKAL